MSFLSDAATMEHAEFLGTYKGPHSQGDFFILKALAQSFLNPSALVSAGADFYTKASTDGTPFASLAAGTISSISVIPTSGAAQMTISKDGNPAVTWPLGQGFEWDSGNPTWKNFNAMVFTVTTGTFAFVIRT